jgi:hypothetical protein
MLKLNLYMNPLLIFYHCCPTKSAYNQKYCHFRKETENLGLGQKSTSPIEKGQLIIGWSIGDGLCRVIDELMDEIILQQI